MIRTWTAAVMALAGTVALAAGNTAAPATALESVRTSFEADRTVVILSGNGLLTPASVIESADQPRRLILDFPNVNAVSSSQDVVSPLVRKVRVALNSRRPLVTRVVMELDQLATYHVERGADAGRDLSVVFAPGKAQAVPASATKAQAPVAQNPVAPVQPPAPLRPQQSPIVIPQVPEKQYVGAPVSLDFVGADLRSVLRALVAHGGLNVVFDNSVQGTIDIVLNDIPWDQALETILRANKLGYVAEGTIIRIAPLSVLAEEEAERRKLAEARALSGDLRVQTFALSYARAQELQPLLTRSALSSRGQIQVDTRTNTLIITDLPDRLQTAANLISGLDRPEPQVEVEARIVQTTRDFARAIGIQWGLNGRMTPEIGNTTNLAFPNRGTLGGRLGETQGAQGTDTRANPIDQTGTVVGLPANPVGSAAVNTAIGLALGSVNGAFNLDVALTALERSGKGRVLSTPRLTTQNNVAAEVGQGVQIPIQTVANNTVTVTFKEALLKLMVTPQITAAGTVIMQVTIENASADFSRQVNGIPPIDTQRAQTQVQVNDGATTVIGGIFVSREQSSTDRTPLMSRIPLLGWLFRRDSIQDESRELLIFITPRIIKG